MHRIKTQHQRKLAKFFSYFIAFAIGLPSVSWAAPTSVIFSFPQPGTPDLGFFPTNAFATADSSTGTGQRINLPASEDRCDKTSSTQAVCGSQQLLNQLDGFSLNPRVRACFSGAIDTSTIKDGLKLVSVTSPTSTVTLNQVVLSETEQCVFAKPDHILNQASQYLLVATNALKDGSGSPVTPDPSFFGCINNPGINPNPNCPALASAISQVQRAGFSETLVGASVFTTMSATSWLEKVQNYVSSFSPALTLPAGLPSSFALSGLRSIDWQPDNSGLPPQNIPLRALPNVGSLAFGLYLSPNYLNSSGPAAGTITTNSVFPVGVPSFLSGLTFGCAPVSFHVFLPSGLPPSGGWPVVIYGHGLGDSQFGAPTYIASTLAANGFATLAIEIMGHGYGPNSTVKLTTKAGNAYSVTTPGRGVQVNPDQPIGSSDGCIIPGPVGTRDCGRQTAVDLFALMKTMQVTGGFGLGLNPGRVYYVGQSFGSMYGTLFQAVDPDVKAAVLNAGGGTTADIARLAITGRPLGSYYLQERGLLNVGPPPQASPQDYFHDAFNDGYVFRGADPQVNAVPGALPIQAAFEASEWLGTLGDPVAYAPHLKTAPLSGVPPKPTLFQSGIGDLEVPNPTNAALIRAADALDSSILFRFDAAVAAHPELAAVTAEASPGITLPILPHRILTNPTLANPDPFYDSERMIAIAEQQTVASYFLSGGRTVPDGDAFLPSNFAGGARLFQPSIPPDSLNFIQIPK